MEKRVAKNKMKWLIGLLTVLVVAGATAAILYFMNRPVEVAEPKEEMSFNFYEVQAADALKEYDDIGVMILECDDMLEFKSLTGAMVTTRQNEYVHGTGALKLLSVRDGNTVYGTFEPKDITAYKDGSVHLSVYINSMEYMGDEDLTIEFTSSGEYDNAEISWSVSPHVLHAGWNELYLGIEDAVVVGEPDLSALNYFRVFTLSGNMGLKMFMDCVYATDTEGMTIEGPKEYASTKSGYLLDFDSLKGLVSSGTMTLVEDAKLHKEGSSAIKVENPTDVWVIAELKACDIAEYKDGKLGLWIYIDDAQNVNNGTVWVELSSGGIYDVNEISWSIPGTELKSGWNEVELRFSEGAQTSAEPVDLSKVNYFRIYGDKCSKSMTVMLDAIRLIPATKIVPTDGMIWDGDSFDNVTIRTKNTIGITTKTGEYKQGSGAIKSTISDIEWWTVTMQDAIDVSKFAGGLHAWLYVEDASKVKSALYVELGSAGVCDVDEYQWEVINLQDGWNELALPFSAAKVSGTPDLSNVNFFRIFAETDDEIVAILDDVRAVKKITESATPEQETDEEIGTENATDDATTEGMILSCDSYLYATIFSDCELKLTNADNEYVQGIAAFKTIGSGQVRLSATLNGAKDLTSYANGGLEVSFYIEDKDAIVSDKICVELSSAGGPDSEELCWEIPVAELEHGWNTKVLRVEDVASTAGDIDFGAVDYLRIYFNNAEASEDLLLIIDNVHMVSVANDTIDMAVEGMILSCDNGKYASFFSDSAMEFAKNADEYVQGTGAFKTTGGGMVRLSATLNESRDLSAYENGGIALSLYVNDKTLLASDKLSVELTSAGTADTEEVCWEIPIAELENGWNTKTLRFSDVVSTAGDLDFGAVDYLRIYFNASENDSNLVVIFDDIHAVAKNEVIGMIWDCEDTDGVNIATNNAISVTTEADTVKQGGGAVQSVGADIAWLGASFSTPVDISEYRNGGLHLWLYIDSVEKLTGSPLVTVELGSAGGPDTAEYQWEIATATLHSGWQEIYLAFAEERKVGDADLQAINWFRLYGGMSNAITVRVDDVYATTSDKVEVQPTWNIATVEQMNGKTGSGTTTAGDTLGTGISYANVSLGTTDYGIVVERTFSPLDFGDYNKEDLALAFWYYAENDGTMGDGQIELGSKAQPDQSEMNWLTYNIPVKKGWNYIVLPMDEVNECHAEFDLNNLIRVRWYGKSTLSGNWNFKITDISVVLQAD